MRRKLIEAVGIAAAVAIGTGYWLGRAIDKAVRLPRGRKP